MGIGRFLITRGLNRLATLLALMVFSFFVFEIIPQALGFRLAYFFAGITELSPTAAQGELQLIHAIEQEYGLNQPLPLRLYHFIVNLFTFHFGTSPTFQEPVIAVIKQYLPNTLILATTSLLASSIISLVLGVYAAKSFVYSKRRTGDKASSIFSLTTHFLHIVWIGPIIYFLLVFQLKIFPVNLSFALNGGGVHAYTGIQYYLRYLWAATLPIIMLTMISFGHRQQLLRNNIIYEYTSSPYVSYARAQGLGRNAVFYRHALRNAILPWVTQVALDVAFLLGGVFFVEVIFEFPGLGYASVTAATNLDIPFLIATTFLFGAYTLIVLFLLDFIYARLDPRIKLGE